MTSQEIKAWRKRCDFTQEVAAKKLGYTASRYRAIENGRSYHTGKPIIPSRRVKLAMLALEHLPDHLLDSV